MQNQPHHKDADQIKDNRTLLSAGNVRSTTAPIDRFPKSVSYSSVAQCSVVAAIHPALVPLPAQGQIV